MVHFCATLATKKFRLSSCDIEMHNTQDINIDTPQL